RRARWPVCILLLAGACASGMAQAGTAPTAQDPSDQTSADDKSPQSPGNGDIPRIKVGTNEVNVVFTVTDKHGKRVTDLKQNDFHFVDDNKPAVEIRSFSAETNFP